MNYNARISLPQTPPMPQTQGAFNNALAVAQANADPRFAIKQMDRPGVSRGAGQKSLAAAQSDQSLAAGVADAYRIPMNDAASNAASTLAYQNLSENSGLQASSIDTQNDYSNALAALQRQRQVLDYQQNALGGLLGGFNWNRFIGGT
jgi:hypothetical protein